MNRNEKDTSKEFTLNQYELFISSVPVGIGINRLDADFTKIFANQGYYAVLGFTETEFLERFPAGGLDAFHPEDRDLVRQTAITQLKENHFVSVRTRVVHKTKGYIWAQYTGQLGISDDGIPVVYISMTDISELMAANEDLEKEHNFNHLISTLTEDAFFDCDIPNKIIRYSKNFADKMGVSEVMENYPESLFDKGIIAPDSLYLYQNRFAQKSDHIIEEEIHLKLPDKSDVWYQYHYHILRDESGTPVRAIGKMSDITRQHIKLEELAQKANRDQLTGLYNKATTEHLIKATLKQRRFTDEKHALMIIDVDHFKDVNDQLGHLYGDIVLTQLADSLKPLFRTDDIVGRVGGDEFFVLMKNYKPVEILKDKAEKIGNAFRKTYTENGATVNISASIGIALFPQHGAEFDELYKAADAALYSAKAAGKDRYSFFADNIKHHYQSARTEIDSRGNLQKSFQDNRVEYIFKLLYASDSAEASIQSVLRLLTEHFGFSRGYVFETSADGRFTSNTFEWCADGISPQIDHLQNLPIETIAAANDSFCRTGMYLVGKAADLPAPTGGTLVSTGIRSTFQFGIINDNDPIGLIGFDDCENERMPTRAEIDEICTICHLLSTFLLKERSTQRERARHQAVETVLDYMNCIAYVIDCDSYEVLYENQNAIQLTKIPSTGAKCHLAYRGLASPCADCPMSHLSETQSRYSADIHNAKYDMDMRIDATWIPWNDMKKACLVSSVDISKQKEGKK